MWFLWLSSSLWQRFPPPCLSFKLWVKFLWFCVLPVVSSAAVNVGVHVSFWKMVFSGYTPSLGMSDAIFNLKFYYFFGGVKILFAILTVWCDICCSFVIFLIISGDAEHLVLCLSLFFSFLKGHEENLPVAVCFLKVGCVWNSFLQYLPQGLSWEVLFLAPPKSLTVGVGIMCSSCSYR